MLAALAAAPSRAAKPVAGVRFAGVTAASAVGCGDDLRAGFAAAFAEDLGRGDFDGDDLRAIGAGRPVDTRRHKRATSKTDEIIGTRKHEAPARGPRH
jgi:hypothetical protein